MAFAAARTDAGTKRQVNEDACCIECAQTPLGEVLMAVVCDGVGGLSRGNLASSTVIDRFARWFEAELPLLMEGMETSGRFDFGTVRIVWEALLQNLNELIRDHGAKAGGRLGTTFTGIIACGGRYLVGHVGDCRAYQMNAQSFAQITQDQTLVAKRLAAGEITEEEARRQPKNVILQSVGTERTLRPVFSEGTFAADDLFVICCDGAYHRAENEGIRHIFQPLNYRDEAALGAACELLLSTDMDLGEKDNLTAVCFSGALAAAGEAAAEAPVAADAPARAAGRHFGAPQAEDEDVLATMVASDDEDEDDFATMVAGDDEPKDEDDLATMVAGDEEDEDEDDLATMVASDDEPEDEDDLATMVASDDGPEDEDEDDLATMVASDEDPEDEDDLATMVDGGDA